MIKLSNKTFIYDKNILKWYLHKNGDKVKKQMKKKYIFENYDIGVDDIDKLLDTISKKS